MFFVLNQLPLDMYVVISIGLKLITAFASWYVLLGSK